MHLFKLRSCRQQINREGYDYLNKLYKLRALINGFISSIFSNAVDHKFFGKFKSDK
jgi:hypothetical protein